MQITKLTEWHFTTSVLAFIIMLAAPTFASTTTAEQTAPKEEPISKLVDTKWLEDNLSMEKLRIVDVRDNVKDYWEGHIPGAVYLNSEAMRWPDRGVPGKLIQPRALAELLGEMGIGKNTMVLVYSRDSDYQATYLIWALDYIGHSRSAVLDGGFNKWKADGKPVTQDYPKINARSYSLSRILNEDVRATLDEVKEAVSLEKAVLIDVRTIDLYTGENGFWKRKGHIKGALSHYWREDLKSDGTWESKEDLKMAYEWLRVTPDKNIIVSCGQGLMSSHSYFTLKYILGYTKVSNYDGGFNEWSNIDELPVETGTK